MPQSHEKQQVIEAIGELGRRVTAADIATKTGLPVLVAQQKLNEVAADVGGHMQVGTAGDIVYSFSPGFSNAYLAKGMQAVLLLIGAKILQVLFYLVRISFGIALIISFAIVIVLIVVMTLIMIRGASGDRDRDNGGFDLGGLGDFRLSFWDWMILRDLFFWNTYRYEPVLYDYSRPTVRRRPRSNFLLNCFSWLFGDGDPNEGLDEKRWQVIAQVIKCNNNVVTAEQLAPYTGADPKNEDAVLPVLVRFNGRPEVTESGNIIYIFESMQSVAADHHIEPPAYLQEFNWKFTNLQSGDLLPVAVVAGLNTAGAWTVWNFFHHISLRGIDDPFILAHWSQFMVLLNVLLAYGVLFLALPAIRSVVNAVRNKAIDARNVKRFQYSQIVAHPSVEVQAKLKDAFSYRIADRKVGKDDVVYTTEKDSLDQDDELSDKFKQLETSGKNPKPKEDTFSAAPDDDGGRIIDIRKKLERDFDASP